MVIICDGWGCHLSCALRALLSPFSHNLGSYIQSILINYKGDITKIRKKLLLAFKSKARYSPIKYWLTISNPGWSFFWDLTVPALAKRSEINIPLLCLAFYLKDCHIIVLFLHDTVAIFLKYSFIFHYCAKFHNWKETKTDTNLLHMYAFLCDAATILQCELFGWESIGSKLQLDTDMLVLQIHVHSTSNIPMKRNTLYYINFYIPNSLTYNLYFTCSLQYLIVVYDLIAGFSLINCDSCVLFCWSMTKIKWLTLAYFL